MKNTIKNEMIHFVSDSFNVEPWELGFNNGKTNYFWWPDNLEKLGTAVIDGVGYISRESCI
jgi:hypothetical protein